MPSLRALAHLAALLLQASSALLLPLPTKLGARLSELIRERIHKMDMRIPPQKTHSVGTKSTEECGNAVSTWRVQHRDITEQKSLKVALSCKSKKSTHLSSLIPSDSYSPTCLLVRIRLVRHGYPSPGEPKWPWKQAASSL